MSMNETIFKSLRKRSLVFKVLICSIPFIVSIDTKGQSSGNNVIDEAYYSLILQIVGQDVSPVLLELYNSKVEDGSMTQAQLDTLLNKRKLKRRNLISSQINEGFKQYLEMDLELELSLTRRFGTKKVKNLASRIDFSSKYDSIKLRNLGEVIHIDKDPNFGHRFSAPIKFEEGKYFVYHNFSMGLLNGHSDIFVIQINNDGTFKFLYTIPISIS